MNDTVVARFDTLGPDLVVETTTEGVASISQDELAELVAFYVEAGCSLRAGVDWMEVMA